MIRRSAPDKALKMKKQQEWTIYLEVLKVLFNLADRLAAFYIPLTERPHFMDSLEDAVSGQLKAVLAPALGPDADTMELTFAIGKTVAESRQTYESFAFVVTEEHPQREALLKLFGERVAAAMDMPGNGLIVTTAGMCASAAIPAMKAVFEGMPVQSAIESSSGGSDRPMGPIDPSHVHRGTGSEIKLISVMSAMEGEEVETRWGLHPRFRQDLKPEEVRELTKLMNRLTRILGQRYAAVAFSADWASWHQIGHA
jgi:hypothetical protein